MPDDASWVRVLNSCNRAILILRAKGYDEPYIDEGNMPANWDELSRKHTELWAAVYAPKKITEASKEELAELYRSVTGKEPELERIKPKGNPGKQVTCPYCGTVFPYGTPGELQVCPKCGSKLLV